MFLFVLIDLVIGAGCIAMGLMVWLKRKVDLLHDYHFRNVREEDLPAYSRAMGIGLIAIGLGISLMGIMDWIGSAYWWIPLVAGFILAMVIFHIAQKKYNGSWFS